MLGNVEDGEPSLNQHLVSIIVFAGQPTGGAQVEPKS